MRSAWSIWFSLAQYRKHKQLDHFSSLVQRNGKNALGTRWEIYEQTLVIQGVAPVLLYKRVPNQDSNQ